MEQIARLWLRTQCRLMAGLCHAIVVLSPEAENSEPRLAAVWPEDDSLHPALRDASAHVLQHKTAVFRAGALTDVDAEGKNADVIACPVLMDGNVVGAVAMAIVAGEPTRQRAAYQSLKLGCAWFEGLVRAETTAVAGRLSNVLEIVASTLEHPRFESAAAALVNTLCERLECDRVSIGMLRGDRIKLAAISHNAIFQPGSKLAQTIVATMQETVRQGAVMRGNKRQGGGQTDAQHAHAYTCSVPVTHDTRMLGVVTLERSAERTFSDDEVDVCEAALALAGPILELKQSQSRLLGHGDSANDPPFGLSRRLRNSIVAVSLLAALVVCAIVEINFRIASPARLEGSVQRTVAATQDGFIAEAPARAGDTVQLGELMARLDDRDLKVEAQKWSSRRSQLEKEYRDALAQHDRSKVSILRAQIAEAEAEYQLAAAQLERTRIVAPFDGVVVNGDLSQSLGAPVARGEVIFEVAPLDGYRIVLNVDERDVAYIAEGQPGQLALTALPHDPLDFTVTRVTPVASDEDGSHHFRVEARLDAATKRLRPGMEGVAKVDVGQASIAFTLTRRLQDWLRLTLWRWMP